MSVATRAAFREIPLQLIDDPALPSRAEMDEAKMQELVDSIRANGILQPIVLVPRGERFEVVAGHRRTIASRLAGLLVVPAMVYAPDHSALRVIQAHENGRREDVNPVDEAIWFHELLTQECGDDVERLAGLVGEKLSYVLGRLELVELDEDTRNALQAGKIKIGVAKALRQIPDLHFRRYYLDCAIRGGSTVPVVEAWVTDWKNTHGAAPLSEQLPPAPTVHVPGPAYDPHQCYLCQKSDPRFIPEQLAVHTHCKLALLDPMLAQARGDTNGA